jgi:glycosyltransferase involved in cell wall biosynthesis
VIITPVRDEEQFIRYTLDSVINQTIKPVEWVIVNDGSTDGTGEIIDKYSKAHSWIKPINRENRGYRKAGGGVIDAFYEGYAAISTDNWEFVVKLDGDLSFGKDYFERCLSCFANDQNLGIAGGIVCLMKDGVLEVDSKGDPPFHVRGATKIYRRACWERISPLVKAPGWDTIDEVRANMYGWATRTLSNLKLIQHKPTGAADGSWMNWFKNGQANYVAGYHPLFMAAKCMKRAFDRPYLIAATGLLYGYIAGYIRKAPRVDDAILISYLRQQQMRRMVGRKSIWR